MPDATSTFAAPVPRFPASQTLIGAVSPLWGYFAGAALVGSAWWWMNRWSGLVAAAPPAEARPVTMTPVAVDPPTPLAAEPPALVGGESAPVSAMAAPSEPPPLIETPPTAVETVAEPQPTPRPRKPKDSEPKPH